MQRVFENELNHLWFPLVDSTDFASIESGIAASSVKVSVFGMLKGSSAPASLTAAGTGSLAASGRDFYDIKSGVIGIILGATELSDTQNAFYDKYLIWASVTGAALQLIEVEGEYVDTSDIYQLVSDVDSQLLVTHSLLSDVDSQLLLTASKVTTIEGSQFDYMSNIAGFAAYYGSRAESVALYNKSLLSDIDSQLLVTHSLLSDVDSQVLLNASLASNAHSAAAQANSRALVIQSLVSDIDSQLLLTASKVTTIEGSQFDYLSDAISGITATVSASDISDIASAVQAILSDTHSNILSAAQQANSRALVIQSMVSDVDSQLNLNASMVSDAYSLAQDIDSQLLLTASKVTTIEGSQFDALSDAISGVEATVGTSAISDIASAVQAILSATHSDILSAAQQGASRALVVQSMVSDVDSQLLLTASKVTAIEGSQFDYLSAAISDAHSDLGSKIGEVTASVSASDISDIASAVQAILSSVHSDILSAAQQTNSRALVIQSMVSDVDSQVNLNASMISDTQSALDSQFAVTSNYLSSISAIASDAHSAAILGASHASNAHSMAQNIDSQLLVTHSLLSDVESQLDVTHSLLSDVDSQLTATDATLSNVQSVVTAIQSDLPARPAKGVQLANFTFPMVDSSDDVSFKTGLTVSGYVSKDGGSLSALTNSVSEIGNGLYKVTLTTTEMNADVVVLRFTASGANDRMVTILTQAT